MEFSGNQTTSVENHSNKLVAALGGLSHKGDVYVRFGTSNLIEIGKFLTNQSRANWLKQFAEQFVPTAQNGVSPSQNSIAFAFDFHYYTNPLFRSSYLRWLNQQNSSIPL